MVGGISWVSTAEYYSHLNRIVNARLGGNHSIKCVLASLDFAEIVANNERNDHEANYVLVLDAAERVKAGGADGLMLCVNTMHMFADRLQADVGLPLIHIASAAAEVAVGRNMKTVGLLGTRFVMEMGFYRKRLEDAGLAVLTPMEEDRAFIHRAIFEELTHDRFLDETKQRFMTIVDGLAARGAQGVVLGCTEIPLLMKDAATELPLLDTTRIHAEAAVDFVLA